MNSWGCGANSSPLFTLDLLRHLISNSGQRSEENGQNRETWFDSSLAAHLKLDDSRLASIPKIHHLGSHLPGGDLTERRRDAKAAISPAFRAENVFHQLATTARAHGHRSASGTQRGLRPQPVEFAFLNMQ